MATSVALAYLFSYSSARIADDSDLWTPSSKDWYSSTAQIGIKNGVPYSNDPVMKRFIEAPVALEGRVENYMSKTNVQRVDEIIGGELGWDYLFPLRNDLYTYTGFLEAVAKFPKFCDDGIGP